MPHTAFFYVGAAWALGGAAESFFDAPLRRVERSRRAVLLAALTLALYVGILWTMDHLEHMEPLEPQPVPDEPVPDEPDASKAK